MEKLDDLLAVADKALASLTVLIGRSDADDVVQDASIQRFEYTLEAVWKACQQLLRYEGISTASPTGTVRYARDARLLSDEDTEMAIRMIDVRNLTTHTYNEVLARGIYPDLPDYCASLKRWISAMRDRVALYDANPL